jgi:hypothetical protein
LVKTGSAHKTFFTKYKRTTTMGLAKTMVVLGAFDFYTPNYTDFTAIIGAKLEANLELEFYFDTETEIQKSNETHNFGFEKTYIMQITYNDYDVESPVLYGIYCTYCVLIPVQFKYEDQVDIEFLPNGIFNIQRLPFSNHWCFFIEDMIENDNSCYNTDSEAITNIVELRHFYIAIFKKMNCNTALIWTDAQYKTEDRYVFNPVPNTKNTVADLADALRTLDNVKIYNFRDVLAQKIAIQSSRVHYLDIALSDYF